MSAPAVSAATGGTPKGFRVDIQALRAVAIVVVVVFHAWPASLPGGFVGVDVFFVISGFLITAHLLREASAPEGLALGRFYARRMRRLLPASLLTLLCTSLVVLLFLPELEWLAVFPHAIAAAAYAVNWLLAAESVDYFAADVANPFQHFWSLSVEEQFYLVWPLLILLGVFLSAKVFRAAGRTRVIAALLGIVAVLSLVTSVWWTAEEPTIAYFATPARAWEFAAGGLLALVPSAWTNALSGHRTSPWIGWTGLALIAWSAATFDSAMPFPGWIAAVPVIGTVLVIAAGASPSRYAPTWFYVIPPVQWIGGISYSLYLWHWPVLILGPAVLQRLGFPSLNRPLVLVGIAVVLAWLSRALVEDPIIRGRALPWLQGPTWRTVTATAGAMAVVIAVAAVPVQTVQTKLDSAHAAREDVITALHAGEPCIGGDALQAGCDDLNGEEYVPSLLIVRSDGSGEPCQQVQTSRLVLTCEFGDPAGTPVALIGDSHMAQWITPFKTLADKNGWHLTTYLRSGCPVVDSAEKLRVSNHCQDWSEAVLQEMATQDFELVFTTARDQYQDVDDPAKVKPIVDALSSTIRRVQDMGARVIAVADTPNPIATSTQDVPSCVSRRSVASCAMPREKAISHDDPISLAAAETAIPLVDATDLLCTADSCPVVIGGVLVYRDSSHVSETYLLTIEDQFVELVDGALATSSTPAATP